jgi:preprotein translocase subunit SecG
MSSTLLTLANILYVLVSIGMIVMILLQRGAGAAAGSGFGAGASATVFGSRGSANFLSKSTAVLATLFFIVSLGMAMYVSRGGRPVQDDLGVMGQAAPAATESAIPAADVEPAQGIPESSEAAPAAVEEAAPETPVEVEKAPSEGESGE